MTEFDAVLKRGFAEAHEPADEGFTSRVRVGVARRERIAQLHGAAMNAGAMIAGLAVLYGLYAFGSVFGPEFMANAGLEVARAHGALSGGMPSVSAPAQGVLQLLGAGLTQILLAVAALAGGAVAYRSAQD